MQTMDPILKGYVPIARACGVRGVKVEKKVSGKEYWIFSSDSRETAMAFLRQVTVPRRLLYVIVETPDGNVGRDCEMLFNESDGSRID